ncbi:hypothetical protein BC826DRAFT_1114235 [Russula brevipes]|nr:hypothetical protein BC826DRAFT_1114235 [Russula brevipes]
MTCAICTESLSPALSDQTLAHRDGYDERVELPGRSHDDLANNLRNLRAPLATRRPPRKEAPLKITSGGHLQGVHSASVGHLCVGQLALHMASTKDQRGRERGKVLGPGLAVIGARIRVILDSGLPQQRIWLDRPNVFQLSPSSPQAYARQRRAFKRTLNPPTG